MANDEMKLEHLKLVEGIVERMASNSCRLKEWFITIASAILSLSLVQSKPSLVAVAGGALLAFWLLDAYYLQQERRFRDLYEAIVDGELIAAFSMNMSKLPVKQRYVKALLCSWSTLGFYGTMGIAGLVLACAIS